jgi:hypothetical protein
MGGEMIAKASHPKLDRRLQAGGRWNQKAASGTRRRQARAESGRLLHSYVDLLATGKRTFPSPDCLAHRSCLNTGNLRTLYLMGNQKLLSVQQNFVSAETDSKGGGQNDLDNTEV